MACDRSNSEQVDSAKGHRILEGKRSIRDMACEHLSRMHETKLCRRTAHEAEMVASNGTSSNIIFEWLTICPFGRAHRKHLTDHIGKTNRYRQPIVIIAGIIIDLRQPHYVAKNG